MLKLYKNRQVQESTTPRTTHTDAVTTSAQKNKDSGACRTRTYHINTRLRLGETSTSQAVGESTPLKFDIQWETPLQTSSSLERFERSCRSHNAQVVTRRLVCHETSELHVTSKLFPPEDGRNT